MMGEADDDDDDSLTKVNKSIQTKFILENVYNKIYKIPKNQMQKAKKIKSIQAISDQLIPIRV